MAVYQAAKKSIGLKQIGSADRDRLRMCLEEVKRTQFMIKDMEREIKRMLKGTLRRSICCLSLGSDLFQPLSF